MELIQYNQYVLFHVSNMFPFFQLLKIQLSGNLEWFQKLDPKLWGYKVTALNRVFSENEKLF